MEEGSREVFVGVPEKWRRQKKKKLFLYKPPNNPIFIKTPLLGNPIFLPLKIKCPYET